MTKYSRREYLRWKEHTLKPHLEAAGEVFCCRCGSTSMLDADHIQSRQQAPWRVMDLSNIQVLCRDCHTEKTTIENWAGFDNDKFINSRHIKDWTERTSFICGKS